MPDPVAIISVRMGSSRLYGKSMKLIGDKPVVGHLVERVQSINEIESVILATSNKSENKVFQEYANQIGIRCFVDRDGDEEDVLGRLLRAGEEVQAKHIARYTGDCPFVYLENLSKVIHHHLDTGADLTFTEKMPLGTFSEIISISAMKKAYYDYGPRYHNPMVTMCMKENPADFKIEILTPPKELQRPELRVTVDTQSDLEIMNIIYEKLHKPDRLLKLIDIIKFLDSNPELRQKNMSVPYKADTRIWY
jgi:spore coat polysaccharide biosynthesis protein SpsF